jgi:TfoX/Sxy family transcriptional regulator of competence genes
MGCLNEQATMKWPMAYDESLAERIRLALVRKKDIEEKKMFGGLCFLLNGNMLVGVWKNSLIARLQSKAMKDFKEMA